MKKGHYKNKRGAQEGAYDDPGTPTGQKENDSMREIADLSKKKNNRVRALALAAFGAMGMLVLAVPSADAESGQVEVKAQNTAKLTLSLSTATSNFGSNLDPSGAASD